MTRRVGAARACRRGAWARREAPRRTVEERAASIAGAISTLCVEEDAEVEEGETRSDAVNNTKQRVVEVGRGVMSVRCGKGRRALGGEHRHSLCARRTGIMRDLVGGALLPTHIQTEKRLIQHEMLGVGKDLKLIY